MLQLGNVQERNEACHVI